MNPIKITHLLTSLFTVTAMNSMCFAGSDTELIDSHDGFRLCDIFDHLTLYDNGESALLQKLAFTGRLQADAMSFNGGDSSYEAFEWRRARGGFKANFAQGFILHAEGDFDLQGGNPIYVGLTDAYLAWSSDDRLKITLGKQSVGFTMDGATSSKRLLTAERGNLTNNLWYTVEYFTGLSAQGESAQWFYKAGAFAADTEAEFSNFEDSYFGLISLGKNISEQLNADIAEVRIDYVHNTSDSDDVGTNRKLTNVVSLNGEFKRGSWGLRTDLAVADGYDGQSDLFGLAILPYYDINDTYQLVVSYNYVNGAEDNGVRINRYETRTLNDSGARADSAHELYAGLNYYLCGHKAKWQNGVTYTNAKGLNKGSSYDGVGFTSAFRLYW